MGMGMEKLKLVNNLYSLIPTSTSMVTNQPELRMKYNHTPYQDYHIASLYQLGNFVIPDVELSSIGTPWLSLKINK